MAFVDGRADFCQFTGTPEEIVIKDYNLFNNFVTNDFVKFINLRKRSNKRL